MPRANKRRRDGAPLDASRLVASVTRHERYAGSDWVVRTITGDSGRPGDYRCPGCQQALPAAEPHVVVWPADGMGGVANRRHWHRACWSARERRSPQGSYR